MSKFFAKMARWMRGETKQFRERTREEREAFARRRREMYARWDAELSR